MNRPFWFVWNEQGRPPTKKHETQALAVAEAQRLARQCRGETFIVLESVSAFIVDDVHRIDLRPQQDDIPF